jgi:hypothetical protein
MPSKKRKDGTFKDIAHPLNNQMRQYLEEKVLTVYRQQVGSGASGEKAGGGAAIGAPAGGGGTTGSDSAGGGGEAGGGSSTEPHS